MIRLLVLLAILAVAGLAAAWLAEMPGQLLVEWQGWEVRAAPGVVVAIFLVLAGLLVATLLMAKFIWGLPRRVSLAWKAQRDRRGWRSLERGLTAAAGGDERGVRNALRGVRVLPRDAPLRLLLEAQAAQLVDDSTKAHATFEKMERGAATELAALRGLVAEVRQQGRHEEALELAERAANRAPPPRWALEDCLDISLRLKDWNKARRMVEQLRRSGHMTETAARRTRAAIAVETARARRADRDAAGAERAASEAISLLPEFAPAVAVAAEIWMSLGRSGEAVKAIRAAWKAKPHPDLALLLLRASGAESPLAGVEVLEELTGLTPDSMEGNLAVAEVAMRAKLFGVSRKYLEKVRSGPHDERVYRMLADLERMGGDDPQAASLWLSAALDARPAPTWYCGVCAEASLRWQAVCDRCGSFDRLQWGFQGRDDGKQMAPRLEQREIEPAVLAGATP